MLQKYHCYITGILFHYQNSVVLPDSITLTEFSYVKKSHYIMLLEFYYVSRIPLHCITRLLIQYQNSSTFSEFCYLLYSTLLDIFYGVCIKLLKFC